MAGGIFAKELEDELMKFTAKSTEQTEADHKTADAGMSSKLVKKHSVNNLIEGQILGKSNVAPMNVPEQLKAKVDTSTCSTDEIFARELEDELMKFTTKSMSVDRTKEFSEDAHDDVDIIGGTKVLGNQLLIEEEYMGTTESSSFDNTDDSRDEDNDFFGDSEVSSSLRVDCVPPQVEFDGFGEFFRTSVKKKVSSHWRSFIQPLTWRFRWVELQIKMLQRLRQRYDRKLEDCHKLKQIQSDESKLKGVCAKQVPFSQINGGNGAMRRKKRKRDEETTDLAKYTSNHKLFSYYKNGKKGTSVAVQPNIPAAQKFDYDNEPWATGGLLLSKLQKSDNPSDDTLQKIFNLESKIVAMKGRVSVILHEISGTSFDPTGPNNGNASSIGTYIAAQLMSEYSLNDDIVPENEAVGHESMVPETITRQEALPQNGEGVSLVNSQVVKEEPNTFEEVQVRPIQRKRSLVIRDRSVNTNSSVRMEDDSTVDNQPSRKVRSVSMLTGPRSKRKRGKRRGVASGRASKRGGK